MKPFAFWTGGWFTLLYIGVGLAVLGTGLTAYGQYESGQAAKAISDYNAQQEEINAAAAARDANIQANQIRERNRQIEAKQYAAYAANGVVADTGSPLLVEMNTHARLEMGALEAEREGGIEAAKDMQRAELDRIEGANTLMGAKYESTGSLIKGIGGAASSYYMGTNGAKGAKKGP